MKLDGFAVQYLLSREFADVEAEGISRGALFDYPMLYDVSADMGGHVVLVPNHERPANDVDMNGTLCVCVGEESARSAREAGAAVLSLRVDFPFQHLYNHVMRVFLEQERLDAQLRTLVDTYAGFQPLLEACAHATGHPCALVDEQYRLVCRSSPEAVAQAGEQDAGPGGEALEPDAIDLFMASPEYRYKRASRTVFTLPSSGNLMMKNVFSQGELVGSLVIEHEGDAFGAIYVRFFLDYLASFVEEAYGRIGSFGVSSVGSGHVKAALAGAAAGNAADRANLEAALAESGHAQDADFAVLRIERSFTNEGADERDYLIRRLELAWPYAYCFEHDGGLFVLVDVSEGLHGGGKGFARDLPAVARDNLVKVGISRSFNDIGLLDAALAQAEIALECGSERDPMNWSYRFGDYAFPWLVERAVGDTPPEFVCHPAVTALLRYDAAHDSELLHTLSVFMRCRYNATTAAGELYVARSTLLHRLARIERLVKIDWDNQSDMAYLALSLAMISRL